MNPERMAEIHASAFTVPRPWSAVEFQDLLSEKTVHVFSQEMGFLLVRILADEAEILTLSVDPQARRQGIARSLLDEFTESAGEMGVNRVFLEVAEQNTAARQLYQAAGFRESGLRKNYYQSATGPRESAIVMTRDG